MLTEVEPLIGTAEVCRRLGLTRNTVLKMARVGRIPGIKIHETLWRFRWSDVEAALGQAK